MGETIRTRDDDLTRPQQQVVDMVRANPGATFRFLADAIGCDHSTARYHCKVLARKGFLEQHKSGREVCNFLASDLHGVDWRFLLPMLRDDRQRRVVEYLIAKPSRQWTVNRLATTVGFSHDSTLRILEKLEQHRFITKEQRPSGRYCIRTDVRLARAWEKCRTGGDYAEGLVQRPVEGDAVDGLPLTRLR